MPSQAGTSATPSATRATAAPTWTYCDTSGTPFAAGDVGQLTVTP